MISFFTSLKPFRGATGIQQANALRSWRHSLPDCEIIVFDRIQGGEALIAELGLTYAPAIACNELGTPLISAMFAEAQRIGAHPIQCYINGDIILLSDFPKAVSRLADWTHFAAVGRRWNLDWEEALDFSRADWEERLRQVVRSRGEQYSPLALDFFVFKRGTISALPAFAIGRPAWDNYLIKHLVRDGVPIIDLSAATQPIHQNHGYAHVQKTRGAWEGPEAEENRKLAAEHFPGFQPHYYSIRNAQWIMTKDELKKERRLSSVLWRVQTKIPDPYRYFAERLWKAPARAARRMVRLRTTSPPAAKLAPPSQLNWQANRPFPRIVIDGVFFQHNQVSGIARVWRAILSEWLKSGYARHIVLLDRAGTAPDMPGLYRRSIAPWDGASSGRDSIMLQTICDEEGADLFVSSYYTSPISTPSIFMAYDMIPEQLGVLNHDQIWTEKKLAILHARKHICISQSTRNDLLHFYPELPADRAVVIPVSVDPVFKPAGHEELQGFRMRHGLQRPYFLVVGERRGVLGYKNGAQLFGTFGSWPERHRFDLVCVGGTETIERDFRAACSDARLHHLRLDDEELRLAYAGATALLYPSRYEGFGIPPLEAMACGCPVVTAPVSSLAEVGADAPVYFDLDAPDGLRRALDEVIRPEIRTEAVARGFKRARAFDWSRIAKQYEEVFADMARAAPSSTTPADGRLWAAFREEQMRQQAMVLDLQAKGSLWPSKHAARANLFRLRKVLLQRLPSGAIPAARVVWRLLLGRAAS